MPQLLSIWHLKPWSFRGNKGTWSDSCHSACQCHINRTYFLCYYRNRNFKKVSYHSARCLLIPNGDGSVLCLANALIIRKNVRKQVQLRKHASHICPTFYSPSDFTQRFCCKRTVSLYLAEQQVLAKHTSLQWKSRMK